MSRQCEITGKKRQIGCNVSHSKRHTKKTFLPNTKKVKLTSDVLKKTFELTLSSHGLRTVEKNGGLDGYLLKSKNGNLNETLKKIKNDILKVQPFEKKETTKKAVAKKEVKKRIAKKAAAPKKETANKKTVAKKATVKKEA